MQHTPTSVELLEYRTTLLNLKENLNTYQQRNDGDHLRHPRQDVTLLVAINGLLRTIDETDPTTLTLGGIVKLSGDVSAVTSSVAHFIARHPIVIRQQDFVSSVRR